MQQKSNDANLFFEFSWPNLLSFSDFVLKTQNPLLLFTARFSFLQLKI